MQQIQFSPSGFSPVHDGATSDLTSAPVLGGVGLTKVSLEGLLLAPPPAPYRFMTREFSSLQKGRSLLLNFRSHQIKCRCSY